jgi:hypothetical protein
MPFPSLRRTKRIHHSSIYATLHQRPPNLAADLRDGRASFVASASPPMFGPRPIRPGRADVYSGRSGLRAAIGGDANATRLPQKMAAPYAIPAPFFPSPRAQLGKDRPHSPHKISAPTPHTTSTYPNPPSLCVRTKWARLPFMDKERHCAHASQNHHSYTPHNNS